MALLTATPADNLQQKVNSLQSGDTLLLTDGQYNSNINLSGKNNVTIQAANLIPVTIVYINNVPVAVGGNVILNAGGFSNAIFGGTNVVLRGITVNSCGNVVQSGAIIPGPNWFLQDVIVQNVNTLGIGWQNSPNVAFLRVYAQNCGYMGFNCGSTDGIARVTGLTVTDAVAIPADE